MSIIHDKQSWGSFEKDSVESREDWQVSVGLFWESLSSESLSTLIITKGNILKIVLRLRLRIRIYLSDVFVFLVSQNQRKVSKLEVRIDRFHMTSQGLICAQN